MKRFRRQILALSALVFLPCAIGTIHAQEAYPSREVRMIVPWSPGGATDVAARALQRIVADEGLRVIVENVPGGGGAIGLSKVAKAAPDGYTIGMGTSSLLALHAQGLTPLRVEDFTAITNASSDPLLLLTPTESGIKTLEDFLRHMKEQPGKVSIGTAGSNNIGHVFAAMTARAAGVDYVHVPYPGGARVITDLSGSQIQAAILKPSESRSQIEAGRVVPIAAYTEERLTWYPEVPTFKEKGFDVFPFGPVKQMSYLVAPAGLPPAVREKLVASFTKAVQSDRYKQFAQESGFFVENLVGDGLDQEVRKIQDAFNRMGTKVFEKAE